MVFISLLRTIVYKGKLSIFVALLLIVYSHGLNEADRLNEYHTRGHVWPPREDEYTPNVEGWKNLFKRRFQQIRFIEDTHDKYNSYLSAVHSGLHTQNFTENGWGITKAPKYIVEELLQALHHGLANNPPLEASTVCIETANAPLMIETNSLNDRIVHELLPLHESWAGVKLVPNNAYGLRVYRNGSTLNMHVDKAETHVISSILHIDHDRAGEPWPLVIEDLQGNTNEVFLESGDMLFYESSKCLHGRPRRFNGSWYSSIFTHYYPEGWDIDQRNMDHYRVPPNWDQLATDKEREEFTFAELAPVEISMKEPECESDWCALEHSVKWRGSPEYGKVMSVGGVITDLDIPPNEEALVQMAKDRRQQKYIKEEEQTSREEF